MALVCLSKPLFKYLCHIFYFFRCQNISGGSLPLIASHCPNNSSLFPVILSLSALSLLLRSFLRRLRRQSSRAARRKGTPRRLNVNRLYYFVVYKDRLLVLHRKLNRFGGNEHVPGSHQLRSRREKQVCCSDNQTTGLFYG